MNFLARYGNFLLFLVLEFYAFYLVAQYNKKPNEIYQSSANLVTGYVYENASTIRNYFSMQAVADSLARENAELRSQLEASKYIAVQERGVVRFPLDTSTVRPDTAHSKDVIQQFNYIAAEVTSNSVSRNDNYMTINRGSNNGIKMGMAVISPDGIVGIVRNVTPHYAQVMSILNKRISITAMIKRNRYFGSLVWDGIDPRIMTLDNIPKHADVIKGDTIMTSGFSEAFPGEIRIGRVVDFRVKNGFHSIDVELWNDLSNIRYVYVVENLMQAELSAFKK
jgi:rod shape-determining protein MreC